MKKLSMSFEDFTHKFVKWAGTSLAFMCALGGILAVFLLSKFYFGSTAAGTTLNTLTSLITFLLIFLMQRSQNKEFKSLQIKLNELISSKHNARNELINIENSTEEDLQRIQEEHEMHKQPRNETGSDS